MQISDNRDPDQSLFRAARQMETKLGDFYGIFSNITVSCKQR